MKFRWVLAAGLAAAAIATSVLAQSERAGQGEDGKPAQEDPGERLAPNGSQPPAGDGASRHAQPASCGSTQIGELQARS